MPTWNKELHGLSLDEIHRISTEYLMGWHDLMACGYAFRPKGLNAMRAKHGLAPLTKEWSMRYRIDYVRNHFTPEEIRETVVGYLGSARVGDTRWEGIELFGCRFGRDYAKAFRELLGSSEYRRVAEEARRAKLVETQLDLYGGVGLAGAATKAKAAATNRVRYGGPNVMADAGVRARLAETNRQKYGGISPFSSNKVREKALRVKDPDLWEAMSQYKQTGALTGGLIESRYEFQVFKLLVARFGANDVFSQYGLHPADPRYPFNCDFYVKSLDLFIELHLHYCHGGHWYDPDDPDDVLRLRNLAANGRGQHYKALSKAWAGNDVRKRKAAADAGLKYLVFWGDGKCCPGRALDDFELWFHEYDCDYESFIADYPQNTY